VIEANGKPSNRFASYWKDAEGMAAAFGHQIAGKTGRPVGIIFLASQKSVPLKNWIAPAFLKDAPSLMEDYKTVGSKYPDNPYYLENVRRYIADWKGYWGEYVPAMMSAKAVPEGGRWGENWGSFPSPEPEVGDSTASHNYNVYVHSFTPAALSGVVFLAGESMVADDQGANFGTEMAALAKCLKSRFTLWQDDADIPLIHTVPGKSLAPKITRPEGIAGKATTVEIGGWTELNGVFEAVVK
jgi:hypothetical protein